MITYLLEKLERVNVELLVFFGYIIKIKFGMAIVVVEDGNGGYSIKGEHVFELCDRDN